MKVFSFLICGLVLSVTAAAQSHMASGNHHPDPQYPLQTTANPVQYKNYYLLTLFQKDPATKALIQNDVELSGLLKNKREQINEAVKSCGNDVSCFTSAVKFSEEDMTRVGNRLRFLFKQSNVLPALVTKHVIPSGCYGLYADLEPQEVLVKAWEQDAKAVNHTINVYVGGQKPNYPIIDSISYNVKDKGYPELVNTNAILSLSTGNSLFFEPSLQFALVALEINERNDAADYEPMATTVNKAAILSIKKTKFADYKYSLIMVPGEGPEEPGTELSAGGMLRSRLAAEQYRKGVAPYIMVSGGRVHPFKTKYSEAYEMKLFLMKTLNIPESAILMEPHARHTTTNMRNAARLIFRYGIPMEKPALVVTVKSQSLYISSQMPERCIKELGYEPYKIGKRLSDQELEFYPNVLSLQIDFDEPMDP